MNSMRDLSNLERRGMVHIYSGDGKGKTTAAVGLAVRAAGHGLRVIFCQFLKGAETGELAPLARLGVETVRAGHTGKFLFQMNEREKEEAAISHKKCLEGVTERVMDGGADILVLDEILDAVNAGLISEESLISLIKSRPRGVEVILTGRNPTPGISALADYRTDLICVRHPYSIGLKAREGIEY